MKKILLVLIGIFILSACSFTSSPSTKAEEYLSRYTSLNEDVLQDLETTTSSENLSTANKDVYKEVLKRQYQNIKYTVKDEEINGDKATVTMKITVYDLYKADKASLDYLNLHNDEFYVNGIINQDKYDTYKVNNMLNTNETVDYEIEMYLNKENGTWIVQDVDNQTLSKIHGLYNYEG